MRRKSTHEGTREGRGYLAELEQHSLQGARVGCGDDLFNMLRVDGTRCLWRNMVPRGSHRLASFHLNVWHTVRALLASEVQLSLSVRRHLLLPRLWLSSRFWLWFWGRKSEVDCLMAIVVE